MNTWIQQGEKGTDMRQIVNKITLIANNSCIELINAMKIAANGVFLNIQDFARVQ